MIKQQYPIELGRVVKAIAGRDEGKFFVVIQLLDSDYVLIADGKRRKTGSPKRKKIKHLQACEERFDGIAAKLAAKSKVFDSELASALRRFNSIEG